MEHKELEPEELRRMEARRDPADIPRLVAEIRHQRNEAVRYMRNWSNASNAAERECKRADAAETEVKRLRERYERETE
jgi:hypothetical protein